MKQHRHRHHHLRRIRRCYAVGLSCSLLSSLAAVARLPYFRPAGPPESTLFYAEPAARTPRRGGRQPSVEPVVTTVRQIRVGRADDRESTSLSGSSTGRASTPSIPLVRSPRPQRAPDSEGRHPSLDPKGDSSMVSGPFSSRNARVIVEHDTAPDGVQIIDIISIGTAKQPELQDAQKRTFGSHPAVRHFFPMTERNDTDAACRAQNLTWENFRRVADFCGREDGRSDEPALILEALQPFRSLRHSPGWMCAQKRPIDGIHAALERYRSGEPLPEYLITMDDDTYYNMELVATTLKASYAADDLYVLGGCMYVHPVRLYFRFPYGGFGTILTRQALVNLMRPITCAAAAAARDGFTRLACWRLSLNHFGEQQFFRDGMGVADLMYAFTSGLRFSDVDTWTVGSGYCFHSDHTLGYFIGYYHVAIPEDLLERAELNDSLRFDNPHGFVDIDNGNQCANEKQKCSPRDSMICHYANPDQMDRLFAGVGEAAAFE